MDSLGKMKNLRRRYRAMQRTSIWVRRKIMEFKEKYKKFWRELGLNKKMVL